MSSPSGNALDSGLLPGPELEKRVILSATLRTANSSTAVRILLDSGSQLNIINSDFARSLSAPIQKLPVPRFATTVDGSPLSTGPIDSVLFGHLSFGSHEEKVALHLAATSSVDIILGIPWHRRHNPVIDYAQDTLLMRHSGSTLIPLSVKNPPSAIKSSSLPAKPLVSLIDEKMFDTLLTEPENHGYLLRVSSVGEDVDISSSDDSTTLETVIPAKYHPYLDVFSKTDADKLPPHRTYDHSIDLELDTQPPFGPLYTLSELELKALREWLDENLAKGFIQPSKSPAGAPILFVKKKDGSLRLCVDYRGLNKISIKNRAALPLIGESLDRLRRAKIFTKLDLRGAYNLVRIKEGDEWKTAFRTRYGHFETLVMPFGLTNAPATFQSFMNDIFRDLLDDFLIIYLDDILIFSNDPDKHAAQVEQVLARLRQHKLFIKAEKCEFDRNRCEFLGFVVSPNGVQMDNGKVKTVLDWPEPTSVKQLQAFLGFANFYRRFIPEFSRTCTPLTKLLKKDAHFSFGQPAKDAFAKLKTSFTTAPVLAHYNPDAPISLETDASDFAIAGILSQPGLNGELRPIAFHSRKMQPAECNYDIYDKELLAIVDSFKIWRHYLEGTPHPIQIFCDHKNLEYFNSTKILTRRQVRWSLVLNSYKYVFNFRPGKNNTKVDAFTRRHDFEEGGNAKASFEEPQVLLRPIQVSPLNAASEPSDVVTRVKAGYDRDPTVKTLLSYLRNPDRRRPPEVNAQLKGMTLDGDGFLLRHGLVYVPEDQALKTDILGQSHDHPTAGHFGRFKTLELLSRNFYWPNISRFVKDYIRTCDLCQRSKPPRHRPYGLLQPLPVPEQPWSSISLDHIVDLPISSGFDAILVVVCRLTKMAHFIPCMSTDTANDFARLFEKNIHRLHGLPKDIVSDRGTLFTSAFWRDVCRQLDIKQNLSTAFHPQSDGQTERVNAIVEQYLRTYSDYLQTNWALMLSLAEFAYNNTASSTTNMTPFYANYGYHPRFSATVRDVPAPAAQDHVKHIKDTHSLCQASMKHAHESQKKYANRRRSPAPDFKEGQLVLLKRTNIRTDRPSDKLDLKLLGPFKILRIVGSSAYRLDLPATMKVHPTFHVSLLEPYHSNDLPARRPAPPPEPIVDDDGDLRYHVKTILKSRLHRRAFQYFVRWAGYDANSDSWIPHTELDDDDPLVLEFHTKHPSAASTPARRQAVRALALQPQVSSLGLMASRSSQTPRNPPGRESTVMVRPARNSKSPAWGSNPGPQPARQKRSQALPVPHPSPVRNFHVEPPARHPITTGRV